MRLAAVALVAGAAGCLEVPTTIYTRDPQLSRAIIQLAQPQLPPGETADLAAAIDAAQHARLPDARAKLIAWAHARGSFALPGNDPAVATNNACSAIAQILAAYRDDDTLDAAVYAGTRIRDEGTGLIAAMCAAQLETKLVALRPGSKADWFDARVDDAELERLIASEIAYEIERPGDHDWRELDAFAAGVLATHKLAEARGLPAAPPDWYPMEVAVHVIVTGRAVPALADYVHKWTAAERAYNAWLLR